MRRVIKILVVILIILSLIAVSAWLLARKKASDTGAVKPTFKEFLTRQSAQDSSQQTGGGELIPDGGSSVDTAAPSTTGTTPLQSGPITVSQFTSGPVTLDQPISEGVSAEGVVGGGLNQGSGVIGAPITTTGLPISQTQTVTDTALSGCQDTDVNIAFTSTEIARLNELQAQFLEIASTLHTDADVQTEQSNYILFKDKADRVTELYNYCQSKAFQITSTPFKYRIATPFWRMPGRDRTGYFQNGAWDDAVADPRNTSESEMMLEQFFKLNLW